MYKIRILTDDFHTFYPYKKEYDEFLKRGIKLFFGDTPDYDLTLIGHSLFQDKKLGSFEASLENHVCWPQNGWVGKFCVTVCGSLADQSHKCIWR